MAQEFLGFIAHTHDTSKVWESQSTLDMGRVRKDEIKSASFSVESDGPCPWPPHAILGRRVKIVVLDEPVEPAPGPRKGE